MSTQTLAKSRSATTNQAHLFADEPAKPKRHPWASLVKKVFLVDVTECPDCGGRMKWLEVCTARRSVLRVLVASGLAPRAPLTPDWTEDKAPPRREPRQERSKQTVEAVLEAVRVVARREGPGAVTTNRIAEAAGVSIGTLFGVDETHWKVMGEKGKEQGGKGKLWQVWAVCSPNAVHYSIKSSRSAEAAGSVLEGLRGVLS